MVTDHLADFSACWLAHHMNLLVSTKNNTFSKIHMRRLHPFKDRGRDAYELGASTSIVTPKNWTTC